IFGARVVEDVPGPDLTVERLDREPHLVVAVAPADLPAEVGLRAVHDGDDGGEDDTEQADDGRQLDDGHPVVATEETKHPTSAPVHSSPEQTWLRDRPRSSRRGSCFRRRRSGK